MWRREVHSSQIAAHPRLYNGATSGVMLKLQKVAPPATMLILQQATHNLQMIITKSKKTTVEKHVEPTLAL